VKAVTEEWVDRRNQIIEEGGGAQALYEHADESATRMLDEDMTERCVEHIDQTKEDRDSLGGIYEVVVTGVPQGLGSYVHWDRRLDGQLVQAICSIQAQKAAEVGDGFFNARRRGSEVHDPIEHGENGEYTRRTNHAGGTEGGTSTGMPLVVRGYMKPIPTLIKPLDSVDTETDEAQPTRYERSDVTSVPAASTVAEATVAFTIAKAFLRKFGGDSIPAIRRHVEADREARAEQRTNNVNE
jgi:chorismate synthase